MDVHRARELMRSASRAVAFTGAGVSTASGVPDFRGPQGLWKRIDPEELTYRRFLADPARFWRWRAELRRSLRLDDAKPNAAHGALADAVLGGRLEAIITQNIDGLHQMAGTPADRVIELHGSGREAVCIDCRERVPMEQAARQLDAGLAVPTCATCNGHLKPAVVLFGEMLPVDALGRASQLASEADVMLVAGSSLAVWPAAGIPERTLDAGGSLIIVNAEPTDLDARASFVLRGAAEEVVPLLYRRP